MAQIRSAQDPRRVLFLVSDGGDNHSRYTEHELRRLVADEDVQIGIHDYAGSMEEARGPWICEDLAKITGEQAYMVRDGG